MTIYAPDSLFDAEVTAGTARRSDPWSSRQAAKQVRPGKAHVAILEAFTAAGGRGTLDDACAAVPKLLRSSVSRRLSDLKDMGRIAETGEYVQGAYGQPVAVWRVL